MPVQQRENTGKPYLEHLDAWPESGPQQLGGFYESG